MKALLKEQHYVQEVQWKNFDYVKQLPQVKEQLPHEKEKQQLPQVKEQLPQEKEKQQLPHEEEKRLRLREPQEQMKRIDHLNEKLNQHSYMD
jgi:hypothetical protein